MLRGSGTFRRGHVMSLGAGVGRHSRVILLLISTSITALVPNFKKNALHCVWLWKLNFQSTLPLTILKRLPLCHTFSLRPMLLRKVELPPLLSLTIVLLLISTGIFERLRSTVCSGIPRSSWYTRGNLRSYHIYLAPSLKPQPQESRSGRDFDP